MGKIYAFIEKDENDLCSSRKFVRLYMDMIDDITQDSNNKIIFTDIYPSGVYIMKYLMLKKFANAIIYCKNEPKYNPDGLPWKSCKKKSKIKKYLLRDSDVNVYL